MGTVVPEEWAGEVSTIKGEIGALARIQRWRRETRKRAVHRQLEGTGVMMTHKYRRCIVALSINKGVEPSEEQKVLTSSFDQGITVNTSKWVFRGFS
jgi:hypothetical protein